ncbi:hypothetical protein K435DRAFT_711026 [Dendrothele bispora CBS 962.96]|uniref:Mediator of RNA polymerase II transcription subunit 12 n=1 Tax=Dendrothele bispora (strain CBS 962.96) TaxID=1314807 RepID=A0A4S8MUM4_DENBC|nr:hypothetical protein K435DRAFT_711026 [Dendrothele bispora CBS 962.96]
MSEPGEAHSSLPVYELCPPNWLPLSHKHADIGYPGFFPPRPGQDEDVLSEVNVKNGFQLSYTTSAETYSSQQSISENLRSHATVSKLEDLMNEVFSRRAKQIPAVPASIFRIPSRVTLNDAKRQAWFDDLANPDVPLHKLGKNVPHGAKGPDLLDLLHSKNVSIPRAVWFLRVFGANETAGLRNKPSYNPTQYSTEWTNVVTAHLRKQLQDIALPSAPRAGVNIKQTFKGVLADPEMREKWISRFSYCLRLLRVFYSEGLINKKAFFVWIVNQMHSCNLAQAGFLTRLADEYFDGMIGSRPLTRTFAEASLTKLSEIRTTSAREYLFDTEGLLKILLQRICIALPDTYVSPRLWMSHSELLLDVLTRHSMPIDEGERDAQSISQVLRENFSDIKKRNETMLFRNLPSLVSVRLGSAVSDVELLNSISSEIDVVNLPFFPASLEDWSGIPEKLDTLLTWSVTPVQFGDHRPFAAGTLIRAWRSRAGDRANRRDITPPDEFLQDKLFEWLDSSSVAAEPESIRAVAMLYGKLVKHELFSPARYIQRLIARGELGLSFDEEKGSRHRNFLRWIPLHESTTSLINQRKITLYGVQARETPEDLNERNIRKELRAVLPELFGGDTSSSLPSITSLQDDCKLLLKATRYEQIRIFHGWLMPVFYKTVASKGSNANYSSILRSYCLIIELMAQTKCFHAILDLTVYILGHCSTVDLLSVVIDTFRRHAIIWASMDLMGHIVSALNASRRQWEIKSRPLLALLVEFDRGRYLSESAREEILADIRAYTLALQPSTAHVDLVPEYLPEILMLADNPMADGPSILANGLWIKYRTSVNWAWKVWDNTVATLRQIPHMTADVVGRRVQALRYGTFLWNVDQHLPAGLDDQVLRWFLGPGKNEVAVLSAEVWDIFAVVLLYLVVHGALKTTTILNGLVYPAWTLAASVSGNPQVQSLEAYLHAANDLCQRLLLKEECNTDVMPPSSLLDLQGLGTRRQDVYEEPHFPLLIGTLPILLSVENNISLDERLRDEAKDIRQRLCMEERFRQGVFRNLDIVRSAFERPLEDTRDDVCKTTMAALRMVLGEPTDDLELSAWPDSASLLSPWKISATAIQLQFVLRQMGRKGALESSGNSGADLDKLTSMIFHHTLSSEEANFVAQMTKGVGSEIAGKFINNGLKHVTEVIRDMSFSESSCAAASSRVGELLRVLIYVAEPLREDSSDLPAIQPQIQDNFFQALSLKFKEVSRILHSENSHSNARSDLMQVTMLLARFLQFDLAFRGVWTEKTRGMSLELATIIFSLTQLHATGNSSDLIAYPLLLDTLYFLLDEIPVDSKLGVFDPFKAYPDLSLSSLPLELPSEYRAQLCTILSDLPDTSAVVNLSSAHRDSSGNLVIDGPVLNRPWEWTENLGEPSSDDVHRSGLSKGKGTLKNSGSLSLHTFGSRMTSEVLPDPSKDSQASANGRFFEDELSTSNVFQRDWRESRMRSKARDENESSKGGRRQTPRVSPSSTSSHSRSSMRNSPGLSRISGSTTNSEIIDVDSFNLPASSSKRKAENESDDSDVVIVSGPVPAPAKKAKTKTTAKKSTKKR